MERIPSETLAVISTAHVPEHEAETLTNGAAERWGGMQREYGWMLHTHGPVSADLPHLNFVLGYLKAHGFDWVLFDADADQVEGLIAFDW